MCRRCVILVGTDVQTVVLCYGSDKWRKMETIKTSIILFHFSLKLIAGEVDPVEGQVSWDQNSTIY